ncbi:MAG TPA: hypothetical protein VJ489_01230 [Thermoplasmata archaeon]|nr:hypothetical protein [Thermoplasmata archaeon]
MDSIADILTSICPEFEKQLKPYLHGIRGSLVQAYLPQTWVFETERETVAISVNPLGKASVSVDRPNTRDVTIRWKHYLLATVLRTRGIVDVPHDERPIVIFHSHKGGIGFGFLRKRFGI